MLTSIIQTPRYRLVADQIAEHIRAGDLPPGSKMPADKDLVAQLGVSRTTVREAMIALELLGYVVTRFGAGAYVANIIPAAPIDTGLPGFFELVEARYVIEPEIAAAAAPVISDSDIAHLEACIDGMCNAKLSPSQIEAQDCEFHMTIARSTGNSVFVQIVNDFWRARMRFPEWTRVNNRQTAAQIARFASDEHRPIVEALRTGDAALARHAMQQHCLNSGKHMHDRWRDQEGEAEQPLPRILREATGA
ncbi:FadR family transcriptional regulator [Donghicola sp. C2-DW-16]|uniref:FadR family transcriptional regulator n=1 Tax=Donghicola mangrovi TaxID=2729614 RepID=A0ABX2PID1_9RHOB|nr:FadR/GntR family transcriptional regulator [Donghicola mangrovi]NVO28656.1 FadR family transcriptional regulator [Donghicola mangrovi]